MHRSFLRLNEENGVLFEKYNLYIISDAYKVLTQLTKIYEDKSKDVGIRATALSYITYIRIASGSFRNTDT